MDKNTLEVTIWKMTFKATGIAAVIVLALSLLIVSCVALLGGFINLTGWTHPLS
jgi:hypothetical protein